MRPWPSTKKMALTMHCILKRGVSWLCGRHPKGGNTDACCAGDLTCRGSARRAQRYEDMDQDVDSCTDDALHTEEVSQRIVWTTPSTGIPKQARGDRRNGDIVVTGPEPAGYPKEVSDPLVRGLPLVSGIAQPTGMFEWLTGASVTNHHHLRFHLKK